MFAYRLFVREPPKVSAVGLLHGVLLKLQVNGLPGASLAVVNLYAAATWIWFDPPPSQLQSPSEIHGPGVLGRHRKAEAAPVEWVAPIPWIATMLISR
jgi:hypothetical protein